MFLSHSVRAASYLEEISVLYSKEMVFLFVAPNNK